MKKALIVQGGWDGHEPVLVAERFAAILRAENFEAEISDTLDSFLDMEKLKALDLIIPVWTMGEISKEQCESVSEAVASGVGVAGCHGGMCDAFRGSVLWQFMTGGNWVSHPGGDGVKYTVNIKNSTSPLVAGISDFEVSSEHYYLHIDPAVEVLATTQFPAPSVKWYHSVNKQVEMPVVWTKRWAHGRVFYNSLGHQNNVFEIPEAIEIMKRGMLWAAEGKRVAVEQGLTLDEFATDKKMF
ncbi:MAG: ThuA domain-containing protein [Clostridiales bacterium]|jgi:type 1 glutamine amidotransferase|nr:ThuA domain-containing protein [Clostridiales bacterium]